jgi:hypothetical protein
MATDKKLKPERVNVAITRTVDLWTCDDLKAAIRQKIDAHVKDVDVAKRLEHLLSDEVAYGTGGGGGVAVS